MVVGSSPTVGVLHKHSTLHCTTIIETKKSTAAGFEPTRAEPNGFRVHLLSHSDTVPDSRHEVGGMGGGRMLKMSTVVESTHRGARTHDHQVKSLTLCRLS